MPAHAATQQDPDPVSARAPACSPAKHLWQRFGLARPTAILRESDKGAASSKRAPRPPRANEWQYTHVVRMADHHWLQGLAVTRPTALPGQISRACSPWDRQQLCRLTTPPPGSDTTALAQVHTRVRTAAHGGARKSTTVRQAGPVSPARPCHSRKARVGAPQVGVPGKRTVPITGSQTCSTSSGRTPASGYRQAGYADKALPANECAMCRRAVTS